MSQYEDALDLSKNVKSQEDTYDALVQLCRSRGLDYFSFIVAALPLQEETAKDRLSLVYNYPAEWIDRYISKDYLCVDPIAVRCRTSVVPLDWATVVRDDDASSEGRKIRHEARAFGLRSGCSFPVHDAQGNMGVLSLASLNEHSAEMNARMQRALPLAQVMLCHLFERALPFLPAPKASTGSPLSEREIECLRWAAEGKTAWETGQILNVSERTAVFHLNNAMKKLGAVNRTHAVVRALQASLITL